MSYARLTPRQQLIAGAAIGALALSGSIGAMRAGRGQCSLIADPSSPGVAFAPLFPDPEPIAPEPIAEEPAVADLP